VYKKIETILDYKHSIKNMLNWAINPEKRKTKKHALREKKEKEKETLRVECEIKKFISVRRKLQRTASHLVRI